MATKRTSKPRETKEERTARMMREAEVKKARERAASLNHLVPTEDVEPDILPPTSADPFRSIRVGYVYGMYIGEVIPAWTEECAHHIGSQVPGNLASRNGKPLYSSKLRAYRALRRAVEYEAAEKLQEIDRKIQELEAKKTTEEQRQRDEENDQ